jgi:hypothetical protein
MMNRTREEHLKFCKEQAYKQYEYDMSGKEYSQPDKAYINACTSMLSDLAKHPETVGLAESCAMLVFMVTSEHSMRRFIDGFN